MTAQTQTIDAWIATHAAHQPDHIALRFEGNSWSYAALHAWVNRLAGGLHHDLGLTRGDRIAFYGHNAADEIALFFAAAKLGLILVPLNWRLAPQELRYIVANCGAKLLVHGPEFAGDIAEVIGTSQTKALNTADGLPESAAPVPSADLSDPYLIVYTSGTTGQPKGAVLTQEAVFWNAVISVHAHDLTASDHILNTLPLFHVGGINIQMMPTFFVGGTVTLHPLFDPARTLDALMHEGVTTTVCVPTMMRALMRGPGWGAAQFPALRMLNTGSTDVPVEILEAVNARGIPMVQVYGATETGPIATYQRAAEAASTIGSIGRAGAHIQVKVVQADGQTCAVDDPGEIWVKAPNTFSHYWDNPAATALALQDGWFKTGDIARQDASGLLWFVGRLKHVIISGGENIYPAEIERIYAALPGIAEVCVVGRADDRWGEVPVVVVVANQDAPSRDALLSACDDKIARFKRPKDVILIDSLPKNALGKVLVDEVRKLVQTAGVQ